MHRSSLGIAASSALGLFLFAPPVHAQRGAITPEWVDATPEGRLVAKTWEVEGRRMRIRGGLLITPGVKALFMQQSAKPENMNVSAYLDVFNDTAAPVCVEMEIEIPSEKKDSTKLVELKEKRGWRQVVKVKEVLWGTQYPVRISAYPDKKKSRLLGTMTAFLIFDEALKAKLQEGKAMAAERWQADQLTYVTISGWPEKAPVQTTEVAEEMVEGTVADALLQSDIRKMIGTEEGADHPGCEMQVMKQVRSASKPGRERWTVKSCDATSTYEVLMVPSPQGGTDFRVRKAEDAATSGAASTAAKKQRTIKEGKPPFEWDEKTSTPQHALTFVEKKRSTIPGIRGTVVEYDLRAAGFSVDEELTLWMKSLDGKFMGLPVVLTPDGTLRMIAEGKPLETHLLSSGFIAGEPLSLTLHSSTSGNRAFRKVVFFPIAAQGPGGCGISLEHQNPGGHDFLMTLRGFAAGENVQVVSQFKKDKRPQTVKVLERGDAISLVSFASNDKGKATVTASGKFCAVSLEFKIGKDALVVQ